MFNYGYILSLTLVLALFAPVSTVANNLVTTLVLPEGRGYLKPSEPIIIEFPFDILANITTKLALEIDTVDVSSLVVVEGSRVIFNPPSPFVVGLHQLRLVEYAANGDIIELGNWRFDVRQSAAFQKQETQFAASLNNSYLISEDYSGEDPDIDKYHASGAANLAYSAQNKDKAVYFQGSLIYEEDRADSATGKNVDLDQFLLSIDANKYARFNIGHHSINYDSLIYSDFNRRGISGQFTAPGVGGSLQVFSSRTGDLRGFNEGLGVQDSDDRVSGAVVSYQPLTSNPENLTITAAYLSGSRRAEDSSIGLLVEESEGDAGSIVIDSLLLNKRARLYFEFAQSDFDYDASDAGFGSQRDNAYRFIGQYAGKPLSNSKTPWLWEVSLEKSIVEPAFYSFSNNALASDRDLTVLTANVDKGRWSSRWFVSQEEDNLDNRFDATNQVRSLGSEITYQINGQSFLGNQTYRLSVNQTQQTQTGTELDIFSDPLPENDNTTDFVELFNEFSYSRGSWYFLVNRNTFTDDSDQQFDSETHAVELGGDFALTKNHLIRASVNSSEVEQEGTSSDIDQTIYRLGIESYFKSIGVRSYMSADYDRLDDQINTDFLEETDRIRISFSLAKRLREAKGLFPGVDLQLRGSYLDVDDRSSFNDDVDFYEMFLDVNFYWDVKKP